MDDTANTGTPMPETPETAAPAAPMTEGEQKPEGTEAAPATDEASAA